MKDKMSGKLIKSLCECSSRVKRGLLLWCLSSQKILGSSGWKIWVSSRHVMWLWGERLCFMLRCCVKISRVVLAETNIRAKTSRLGLLTNDGRWSVRPKRMASGWKEKRKRRFWVYVTCHKCLWCLQPVESSRVRGQGVRKIEMVARLGKVERDEAHAS